MNTPPNTTPCVICGAKTQGEYCDRHICAHYCNACGRRMEESRFFGVLPVLRRIGKTLRKTLRFLACLFP